MAEYSYHTDSHGETHLLTEDRYDADRNRADIPGSYSYRRDTWEDDRLVSTAFYGADGQLTRPTGGFAQIVYEGKWFTPLREALSAFVDKTQERVNGTVKLKLYKGNMINAGVWSPNSLYDPEIATFGESDYNQADATGFINLYGLPIQVQATVDGK